MALEGVARSIENDARKVRQFRFATTFNANLYHCLPRDNSISSNVMKGTKHRCRFWPWNDADPALQWALFTSRNHRSATEHPPCQTLTRPARVGGRPLSLLSPRRSFWQAGWPKSHCLLAARGMRIAYGSQCCACMDRNQKTGTTLLHCTAS
jgi:hypothetical protein